MRLWLTKNPEIAVQDQIVAQVRAAIASGDLRPGERLPSTREVARRFTIHPNTVSAAYRQLARSGEVAKRAGSGVFVIDAVGRGERLERLLDDFLKTVESQGFSIADVAESIGRRTSPKRGARELALFEPDPELAEIIIHELRNAGARVSLVGSDALAAAIKKGSLLVAMSDEKPRLAQLISDGHDRLFLSANSVVMSMVGQERPSAEEIVAIVSAWEDFRTFARLFLVAAKVDPAAIVTISSRDEVWKRKLRAASIIICDSVVAANLSGDDRVRVFPIISADSLARLIPGTP